jgi:NAD(P)H-dependent flavin oxidoreductase YrpB (nitropropane dioxygenase family)
LICAQGGEAGGHTGDIPFSILLPACAEICQKYRSPLLGEPVILVGAGGVSGGRSLAAALMLGASGVWVGTRFAAAKESNATKQAKAEFVFLLLRLYHFYDTDCVRQHHQRRIRLGHQINSVEWSAVKSVTQSIHR